jgi:ribosomal subunit interface protein
MQQPLQITFRHMEPSAALEAKIRERTEELERFHERITGCHVVVEAVQSRHQQGNLYRVGIDLTVPGGELAVNRAPDEHQSYQDAYVAVRDSFDALRRKLEDFARRHRGDVKYHEPPPHGRVHKLVPLEDYGIITSSDGREIYFHRNSLLNSTLEELRIGDEVRFAEESGDQGPQASSVTLAGKHHIPG